MNWARWEAPSSRCAAGPASGARALMAWSLETYAEAFSMGIYNCRPVRGSTAPSVHGEGRADDVGFPIIDGRANPAGHRLVGRLGEHGKRLGIQAVIFDRTIWSATSPGGRRYDGVAPHRDHAHIELTRAAAGRLTLATLRAVLGGPDEEETVVPDGPDIIDLQEDLNFLRGKLWVDGAPFDRLKEDGVAGDNTIGALDEIRRVFGRSRHLGRRPSLVDMDKVDRAIHEVKYHDLRV